MTKSSVEEQTLTCKFCDKKFVRESSLVKHACTTKLRWLDKDTKTSQIAFTAYQRFYKTTTQNKTPDFDHFIRSKYYLGFIKFGRHVVALGVRHPLDFIDYVIKSSIPLDKWCNNMVYEEYIMMRQNREHWETGLERTVATMVEWAETHDREWTDFFDHVHPNEFTRMITLGKISPWWIYSSDKAKALIGLLNEEQLLMIHKFVDSMVWKRRLLADKNETRKLQKFITEHNL